MLARRAGSSTLFNELALSDFSLTKTVPNFVPQLTQNPERTSPMLHFNGGRPAGFDKDLPTVIPGEGGAETCEADFMEL